MTLVVDANIAVKRFVDQDGADDARRVQAYRGPLVASAMTADKRFINRLSATKYSSNVVHLSDWK
jgi:predicted nucleic acid-binding protein